MGPRYGRRAVAFFKRFFKWIGRGAKKVGGFLKKVAPIALLAASAFFTFGSALGLTAGWALKVGNLVSKLGIGGRMAGILSGAIVQSGQGAMIGGVTGLLSGQGFMKGASAGAKIGAVTGGVTGGFRPVSAVGGQPAGSGPGTAGNPLTSTTGPAGVLPSTQFMNTVGPTKSAFGSVWENVIGSGGIGPIIQGVGAGLARGSEQSSIDKRDEDHRNSYDVEYTPIKTMFRNSGGRILADSFGEETSGGRILANSFA